MNLRDMNPNSAFSAYARTHKKDKIFSLNSGSQISEKLESNIYEEGGMTFTFHPAGGGYVDCNVDFEDGYQSANKINKIYKRRFDSKSQIRNQIEEMGVLKKVPDVRDIAEDINYRITKDQLELLESLGEVKQFWKKQPLEGKAAYNHNRYGNVLWRLTKIIQTLLTGQPELLTIQLEQDQWNRSPTMTTGFDYTAEQFLDTTATDLLVITLATEDLTSDYARPLYPILGGTSCLYQLGKIPQAHIPVRL